MYYPKSTSFQEVDASSQLYSLPSSGIATGASHNQVSSFITQELKGLGAMITVYYFCKMANFSSPLY